MRGNTCAFLLLKNNCILRNPLCEREARKQLRENRNTSRSTCGWTLSRQQPPHSARSSQLKVSLRYTSRNRTRSSFSEHHASKLEKRTTARRLSCCTELPASITDDSAVEPVDGRVGTFHTRLTGDTDPRKVSRVPEGIAHKTYSFRGFRCTYWVRHAEQPNSPERPAMICIHGFGAGAFHWQKMMTRISRAGCDVFALDLLGFGDADMPLPSDGSSLQPYSFQYTFENWSEQILHFMKEVLPSETKRKHARKRDVVLVANSIGCVVALQTAYSAFVRYANREVDDAFSIRGVMCLNPSLRQLHFRKRRGFSRWTTPLSLRVLRFRPLARVFFDWVRRPETLRRLLSSAYAVSGAEAAEVVTSDLVERIRAPSMRAGALEVFLAFTSYDRGPLAEELVEQIREVAARERLEAPKVWVLWGERDPWESCTVGRALFANNPSVDRFVELKSLGHCPHDQDPDTVMRYLHEFVASLESYVGRTRDVQPEPFDIDADSP